MMVTRTFPMWPSVGRLVNLKDVLWFIGENSWEWRVFDLDGMGTLPRDMSWDEFDENVESAPYVLDWPGIVEFATGLVQVMNGDIRAVHGGEEVARIEAFDSSEWTVSLRAADAGDFDSRFAQLLGGAS